MTTTAAGSAAAAAGTAAALADRLEIQELVTRHALWMDERARTDPRLLFTEDVAVTTPAGPVQGIGPLVDRIHRHHPDAERAQHRLSNILVDLDGDRAAVRALLHVTRIPRPDSEPLFLGGTYTYRAVRTPAGWRLAGLEMTPLWRTGPWPDHH
ncbi:nuclear transport factor 2 family protein [Streptomyces aidingensis]|uniref:SnoaL-like domain-containing protein n=1 Tax=Streptomyces aidingensis TaxID=910347 RepID=A0A1I1TEU3_9ACTN|nr:nuclear transport factor 2 family protein [Streptomyces aidingensis]SFD57094.1 SnoaL-like domain-containing protein [Streptomyces aidingensis]